MRGLTDQEAELLAECCDVLFILERGTNILDTEQPVLSRLEARGLIVWTLKSGFIDDEWCEQEFADTTRLGLLALRIHNAMRLAGLIAA